MGQESETVVRDRLATIRTELANERTVLAYGRTAVAFGAGGIGLVKLFDAPVMVWLGWAWIAGAVVTLVLGIVRFRQARHEIARRSDPHQEWPQ